MRIYLLEDELETKVNFTAGAQEVTFSIEGVEQKFFLKNIAGKSYYSRDGLAWSFYAPNYGVQLQLGGKTKKIYFGFKPSGLSQNDPGSLVTQMPGKVVKVMAKVGDKVVKGQSLLILEAMKMENEVKAGKDGEISEVHVKDGQAVDSGQVLISII